MKKRHIYGDDLKEQLRAGARDRLHRFVMSGNQVRGAILNATKMVYEMKANHGYGILETLVMGHAYIAAALLASGLKGNDRLALQIDCSGPVKGLIAEANAYGEVRGYLKNVPIPVDRPVESYNLSPYFGAGFLSVTKYLEDAKQPFKGQVELLYGNIAEDLTYYYLKSEQTPTAVNLSIQFDSEGEVAGAGGLLVQVLPGADEQTVDQLETWVKRLPSLGRYVAGKPDVSGLVETFLAPCRPKMLDSYRVEFMCRCNADRMKQYLAMLPREDIIDLAENGPFPLELTCHYCNTRYHISREELQVIRTAGQRSG